MNEYIKKLFIIPKNLEEQKASDSREYKIAFWGFLTTALLLSFSVVRHWSLKAYTEERSLFYIIFLNILGFAISSDLSYRFSGQAKHLKSFSALKKTKLIFYFVFAVIIGVPYMFMASWLYFAQDYFGAALLILIFSAALLVLYFYDWRRFLRVQASEKEINQ